MSENEEIVLGMWEDYDREGLTGILRWASEDAVWRPHSSSQSVFRSTAEYGADMERALAEGIRVGKVRWTASSPDLGGLLADAGVPARASGAYIAMHHTEGVG